MTPLPGSSTCPMCGGEHEPVTIAGVRVLPCPEVRPGEIVGVTAPPVNVQPLHTSQIRAWVRDPDWTHKPADPPGCVE